MDTVRTEYTEIEVDDDPGTIRTEEVDDAEVDELQLKKKDF